MKFSGLLRACCNLLTAGLILFCLSAVAQDKEIRLRHGSITTSPAMKAAAMARMQRGTMSPQASGLYLVQFESHLTGAERSRLRAMGVELLTYVPDDAFIARFTKVSQDAIQALDFVRWAGPYQADYKIASRLSAAAQNALIKHKATSTNVTILIAPGATPAEMAQIKSLFSAVHHQSNLRMGTVLQGQLNLANLSLLSQSSPVLWIEPAPRRKLVDEAASKIVGGDDGQVATPTVTQQLGYDGSGVTVCVADTGLDTGDTNTMHPDLSGRVTGFQFYGTNILDGSDGYGHGTHCAGIVAGDAATGETDPDTGQLYGLGVASGANLFIERIFDDDANEASPFPSDGTLTQDAVRHGAKIGSNSWGNDAQGDYDIDAATFDELVRDADPGTPGDQPYVLEFSAGNAGPGSQTMDSPASAKNVIATGASENAPGILALTYGLYADGADTMADFSSRGPCADGRIKPDLVAPGTWIASAASAYADESSVAWTVIDDYYVYMGGTSMSGPHAAGAAAVFMQFYEATHTNAVPSPALVKAALINSAEQLDPANGGPGVAPNNDEGWGRITLTNIVVNDVNTAPRVYQYLDQTVLLTNSQVYSQHIFVQSSDQPLKVTLAYTDVPGFPGAIPALVNDLDLELVAPDGTLYRGNQFGAGESVPNAPSPDTLNNVEGIYLSQPVPGDYTMRVRGSKIVQDAITNTPGVIDQDFALVSSGDLVRPGKGFILLDRPGYTAPGVMQLAVFDVARAASNTVSVSVTNLTGRASVFTQLQAVGNYGAFTGAVATVTGTAGAGQIQIANGDELEADYVDSGGTKRTATAVADLIQPAISSVTTATDVGVLAVTWHTDEPSTSIVRYGTNSSNLNLGVTNLALVTDHVVKLTGLIPGKTYYYLIVSDDAAGNVRVADNSGAFYSFIGLRAPTVLVVDDYDTAAEAANGSTVIPDGVYTNVLAAAGVSYGFWKVAERGSPQLADLKPFPVVIWRTTDDAINYGVDADGFPDPTATNNTLNAQQQFMIQSYLNGGGSFFMASMGILTQLGDTPFRRNVLQVAGFTQNTSLLGICSDCDEDHGVPAFFGAPSSVASGMYETLDYSKYPAFDFDEFSFGPDFSDIFTPSSDATAIAFESASGRPCGMSYPNIGVDSPGRVVFLSFPFDAIPTNGIAPNNAVSLMQNIIAFLAPGANGQGVVFLDNSVYTANDVVTVEVGDSDLTGAGQAQISFAASSRTNKTTVTLLETTHPGLFRGSLTLVAGNAAANQLQVANGDTITAAYFDASNGSNVVATASVDTVPPGITNVAATTDFYNAQVTWQTSKPTDSAVQYGGFPQPPANSVYSSALVTNHSMTISGLLANHIYNFQVVSRDQAGNTTVDDNNGNFYTFTTLRAPAPPWFDNLEGSINGWTALADPDIGSDVTWTLHTPNNGLVSNAHSGVNAWDSGHQISFWGSTYLYSPIIDLSGLKSATLTFWDVCDFSGSGEDGVVFVSTDSSEPPSLSLPVAMDFAGNVADTWQQETVDLSPWIGKTVQIVFYYQGFGAANYYGWLIDDVSITGVTSGGNISITKNLNEGSWSLSSVSPIGLVPVQSGTAPSVTVSNLPAADYVVQFGDVPFYQTPPAQTNTLVVNGSLNFIGNYTFTDVNSNGIPDSFEWNYFGTISTNRTQLTDTDGDGMSDYAEFIAGTNPTNAASKLDFVSATVQTNRLVELKWATVPGRMYQIESASNLTTWTPVTDWQQATTSQMTYSGTNAATGSQFFRVQVRQ